MNMVFFPLKKTKIIKQLLLKDNINQTEIAKKYGYSLKNVKYGEYLIFLSKIYHYIPINLEKIQDGHLILDIKIHLHLMEKKGYLDYFEPINYSKITNTAIDEY